MHFADQSGFFALIRLLLVWGESDHCHCLGILSDLWYLYLSHKMALNEIAGRPILDISCLILDY